MAVATILGFPRIGASRELKTALEAFWLNKISASDLNKTAANLRITHWHQQQAAGMAVSPSNDFSFYDQMLDMSVLFGVVPDRYGWKGNRVDHETYFAMARGLQAKGHDVPACEMTKWFDTNYHYIVPEFKADQDFMVSSTKPVDEFNEAKAIGMITRPVLIGPITYLLLGKSEGDFKLGLLDRLLPAYIEVLQSLERAGAEWVQFDEPALALDIDPTTRKLMTTTYERLRQATGLKLFVTSYFGSVTDKMDTVLNLPVDAVHFDLVRGAGQLDKYLQQIPSRLIVSLGVVDGRNIWRNNLEASLRTLEKVAEVVGIERVWVSSSCSLLHTPYDLNKETLLDDELKGWMAFSEQKMREIKSLTKGLNEGRTAIHEELVASDESVAARSASRRIHNPRVADRLAANPLNGAGRAQPYAHRREAQVNKLHLPFFPTTTIGSFPQTDEVRHARAAYKKGKVTQEQYETFLKQQIRDAVSIQNDIGLDVLVHGEFERNDMVEYFGERLSGFTFLKNGWVQSYGSRCVKPPVIFGDVSRPGPMTIDWSTYAQSLTTKPMKGMLTGPVTILQWSFVRDDQPRSVTAHQIALALQDEVIDLEKAGIGVIQIDEPAFREGLPLRRADWVPYLTWATQAFRLATTGIRDETQIHTHMCYAEFNDIVSWLKELDADVISMETSRSRMELLDAFIEFKYPNEIGPGVYDIHSPRIPSKDEMVQLLEAACKRLDEKQVWVNPDCGLKTRAWPETKASLMNMVAAAQLMRARRSMRRS